MKASPRDSRLNPHNQQRCAFRREAKRTDTNKGNVSKRQSLPSPKQESQEEAKPNKELKGSEDMTYWHNWWNQLNGVQKQLILLLSSADDLYYRAVQCPRAVLLEEFPSLQRTMIKYFTANPAASHYSVFHMVANMYVLWTFLHQHRSPSWAGSSSSPSTSPLVRFSNMVSYCCKTATGRLYPSLGSVRCGDDRAGSAGNALKALIAMDTAGLIMGWRYLDHAAHLGGLFLEYGTSHTVTK
ncbi:unnamed protein product [Boreogadus saida]